MTQDPHAALQHLYSIPGITRILTRYNDTPVIPDHGTLFLTVINSSGHGKIATSPSSIAVLSDLHKETIQHFHSLTRSQPHSRANSSTSISSLTSPPTRVAPIEPITILPGSGISPNTVQILLVILLRVGLKEIHLSAGRFVESEMQYRKRAGREDVDATGMGMGEWKAWKTEEHVVRQMRGILDRAVAASPQNFTGLSGSPLQRE